MLLVSVPSLLVVVVVSFRHPTWECCSGIVAVVTIRVFGDHHSAAAAAAAACPVFRPSFDNSKNKDTIRILCSLQYVALRCVAFPLVHLSASFHFVSSSSSFNVAALQCIVSFSRRRTGLRVVCILQEYVSSWYQRLSHHHRSMPLIAVTRNPHSLVVSHTSTSTTLCMIYPLPCSLIHPVFFRGCSCGGTCSYLCAS